MMSKANKFSVLSLLLVFFFGVLSINAQTHSKGYIIKESKDGVEISYKWKKAKRFSSDSPYELYLKVENKNPYRTSVEFEIIYYWKAQLHSSSGPKNYCLKANSSIRGKRWNLVYESDFIIQERFLDPLFTFYINIIKVNPDKTCDPKLIF